MAAEKDAGKTACQIIRELVQQHDPYWRPYRMAMRTEKAFLAGSRYAEDSGPYQKDRRLVQIKGQEIQSTIRHVVAQVTSKPRSIEARIVDSVDDADTAEVAVSLIEWRTKRPDLGFDECFEEALQDARESRLGVVWMDWDPDCGIYGEILFSTQPNDKIMWEPGYHPHHPNCSWLIIEKRVDVEIAKRIYKAPWLQADRVSCASDNFQPGTPLMSDSGTTNGPYDDNKVGLWFCYYKNDQSLKDKPVTDEQMPLDEKKRYMVCTGGGLAGGPCGYRTPTQEQMDSAPPSPEMAAMDEDPEKPGMQFPELLPQGCPKILDDMGSVCGGTLERMDAQEQSHTVLAYTKGRKLVIMAPLCQGPNDKPLYEDKWPIPTCRSFPGFFFTAYTKSGKPMGDSDTTLMWYQQIASDQLATMAVQRIFEHRAYYVMPEVGLYNRKKKRFEFRDDDFNVMYRDNTKAGFGPLNVDVLNGTGLDPEWGNVFNTVQMKLTSERGTADLGPVEERKNKSGVALQTEASIGEIPGAHFKRRVNRALSMGYGVLWDMERATLTPERAARLRIDGLDQIANMAGDDLPNYDFSVEDTPDFSGLNEQKQAAFDGLLTALERGLTLGLDPKATVELYAETNDIPRSVLRKFVKMLDQAQEEADQEAAMMNDPAAAGGAGAPGGATAPGAPQMNGAPADAGMEPVPAQ